MWDRLLWGVQFKARASDKPILLGQAWHTAAIEMYASEPSRALLFRTRRAARQWCDQKNDEYASRNDFLSMWRVVPVRVRETVQVVK